jgi:hypothetical protein
MATKRPPTPAAKAKAAPREKIVKKSVKKAPVKTPVKTRAKALAKVPAKTFPNPQSRFSLTGIAVQVQRVVDRFPLPVLAALVYTFLGWIGAVTGHWNGNNDLVPYMAHAGIGFYWFSGGAAAGGKPGLVFWPSGLGGGGRLCPAGAALLYV